MELVIGLQKKNVVGGTRRVSSKKLYRTRALFESLAFQSRELFIHTLWKVLRTSAQYRKPPIEFVTSHNGRGILM